MSDSPAAILFDTTGNEKGIASNPVRVDGYVTVSQPTASSLNATVVQSTGSNLHTVVDSGSITANIGTSGSLALDATLTGGTQKAIARGGAKGTTTAADVTSTAEGTDHQALDVQIMSGGVAKDPTQIRALTSSDVVTAAQATAANLNATVVQSTGSNLHMVLDSGTLTNITNAVTVSQATPANLNATVSQGTGSNLHTVLDSGTLTTITNAVTVAQATAASLNATVVQSTGSNLHTVVDSGSITANIGTSGSLALDATLTGGTQKAIVRGGAKGATSAADVTSTAEGTDHQALDVQLYNGGTAINPTQIRALTSSDTVTAVQTTGSNLHTVVDSGTLTSITNAVTVAQATAASLNATVVQSTGSNLHTVVDSGTLTSITNAVTVAQATAASLNATVVQSTGTNLHTVLDSGTLTSITNAVTVAQATAASLNATVVQSTGSNLHTVVDSGSITANIGTSGSLALDATLTGGTQKAIVRGGAKGATAAADVTSTAEGTDHQALDVQLYNGGTAINPTQIRALTSSDVVTATQSTAANLNATVVQATGANLHTVLDSGTLTSITNAVTVSQATAANLNATVVQSTAANLRSQTSSESNTGSAVPAQASMVGGTDGTNLRALSVSATGVLNASAIGTLTNNNAAPAATNVGVLPAVATTAAPTYTTGNQVALSTDLSGNLRIAGTVNSAIAYSSYQPSPNNIPGVSAQLSVDAKGRLETHSVVTSDEGTFRDDFSGTALTTALTGTITFTNASTAITGSGTTFTTQLSVNDYIKKTADADTLYVRVASITSDTQLVLASNYTGTSASSTAVVSNWLIASPTGGSLAVANSIFTIATGTTNGAVGSIQRIGNYLPYTSQWLVSLSQRIANQNFVIGFQNAISGTQQQAVVQFTGTNNTQVNLVTGVSSAAADIQTTTVTLPNNGTTNTYRLYRLDISSNQVTLSIDNVIVANHATHIPGPYDVLNFVAVATNTAAPASTTSMNIDFCYSSNKDRVQVDGDFPGEPLPIKGIIRPFYGANNQAMTITLASLANAGSRSSVAVNNTVALFEDVLLFVRVTTTTAAAATGYINIYGYGSVDGGTTYPEAIAGTDVAVTLSNPPNLVLLAQITANANTTAFTAGPFSFCRNYGIDRLPTHWGVVLVNRSGSTLNATGSTHFIRYQGVNGQIQ